MFAHSPKFQNVKVAKENPDNIDDNIGAKNSVLCVRFDSNIFRNQDECSTQIQAYTTDTFVIF
jgi:hypothetical protein